MKWICTFEKSTLWAIIFVCWWLCSYGCIRFCVWATVIVGRSRGLFVRWGTCGAAWAKMTTCKSADPASHILFICCTCCLLDWTSRHWTVLRKKIYKIIGTLIRSIYHNLKQERQEPNRQPQTWTIGTGTVKLERQKPNWKSGTGWNWNWETEPPPGGGSLGPMGPHPPPSTPHPPPHPPSIII